MGKHAQHPILTLNSKTHETRERLMRLVNHVSYYWHNKPRRLQTHFPQGIEISATETTVLVNGT
jgi:hypothetical protein